MRQILSCYGHQNQIDLLGLGEAGSEDMMDAQIGIRIDAWFHDCSPGWVKCQNTRQLVGMPLMGHSSRSANAFLFASTRMDGV
jgi:hypothetical protein